MSKTIGMKLGSELNYKEIYFEPGSDVTEAVNLLLAYKERGEMVYGEFNGRALYSDTVTLDSAYELITGTTKAEFDQSRLEAAERYKKLQDEHTASIPQLTLEWIEKGNAILDESKREIWAEVVPIRLADLYQGLELGSTLEIVEVLNTGGTLEAAEEIIDGQGHSGMSRSLVMSMVRLFADRGDEFVAHVTNSLWKDLNTPKSN